MKKVCLTLTVFLLALTACQKEVKQNEEVRYSNYYVRSPKDNSKWMTIEEYNRLYPPTKMVTKGWDDCFYRNEGETKYHPGKTCMNERKTGCTDPAGCRPEPVSY